MFEFSNPEGDLHALGTGNHDTISIQSSHVPLSASSIPQDNRTALVIGSNGFVGSHLVRALLEHKEWDMIICVVRDRQNRPAKQRLEKSLLRCNVTQFKSENRSIVCVAGSYTEKRFGMTHGQYNQLLHSVDTVFHVAGTTAYEPCYEELRNDFVLSTLGLLDFCSQGKAKQLHYLSSASILLFQNPEDFQQHTWWKSGYARMKWVNAAILRTAAEQFGLTSSAYHSPYVVGATNTNRDPMLAYSFWQLVVACAQAKVIWDGSFLQFVPVNLLCDAILANACRQSPIADVFPTLAPLGTSSIANLLDCDVLSPIEFFGLSADKLNAKLNELRNGTDYTDIENVTHPGNLGLLLDHEIVPDSLSVFKAGLSQPVLQRAIRNRTKLACP